MSANAVLLLLLAPVFVVLIAWIHWSIFGWGAGPPSGRDEDHSR